MSNISLTSSNSSRNDPPKSATTRGELLAIAAASGLASHRANHLASSLASLPILKELQNNGPTHVTRSQKAKIISKALADSDATMSKIKAFGLKNAWKLDKALYSPGPTYTHRFPTIGVRRAYVQNGNSKNFHTLVHELGHAVDFSRPGPLNLKRNTAILSHLLTRTPASTIIGAGVLASSNPDTAAYAPLVPVLTKLPTLRSEVAANVQGYNLLRNANVSRAGKNRFLQVAAKNLMGYTAPVLASAAILELGVQARRHYDKAQSQYKE